MSLGGIVSVPLLSALMLAPIATTAQTGSSASSESGTALSQQVPAASAGTEGAANPTDKSPLAGQQDDGSIHARELRFERFFSLILDWDEAESQAAQDAPQGQSNFTPGHAVRDVGLTADEAASVLQIASNWRDDIQTSSRDALKVVAAVRAANPGVHMDRTNSPQIRDLYEKRWRITDDAIDELMGVLGTKSRRKVDKFTAHMSSYEQTLR